MPRSIAASTIGRTVRAPARWPAAVGSLRREAHRPFPSMMIATDWATSGSSTSGSARMRESVRIRERSFIDDERRSHFHDFGFLALQDLVDLRDVVVGELLDAALGGALLVVTDIAALDQCLEVLDRVTPHVSHRDTPLLRHVAHELHELLAALLGELRDRQANHLAVVRRREAEIRLHDRLLDTLERRRVERLDREQSRLGRADRRHVLERRRGAVVVDLDPVEQRRRRPARAHRVEVLVRRVDRLVHPLNRIADEILDHVFSPSRDVETMVPICSPASTRAMFPGESSNTWIGRLLSIQRDSAVVSITFNPRSIACKWVSAGINFASGSTRGSPSSTPATPCLAIRIASARTSRARSAAAVSVVKYGLPVPAAKITMRPFSRCRSARRLMYGSATSCISIAVMTRVSAPCRSSASWTARAFSTVPSMPM